MSDIEKEGRYYSRIFFVPSVVARHCTLGGKKAAADAAHCDEVGPQSYGTTFKVIMYDTNIHLIPLGFAHFVGTAKYEYYRTVFPACKKISGFEVPERTTTLDQQKSIENAYREFFNEAKMFLGFLHVRKNMGIKLGASKEIRWSLYEHAMHVISRPAMDAIVAEHKEA